MFGVLIESRAGKQRRGVGALTSIVLHSAIIAGAVALTAHSATSTTVEKQPARTDVIYIPTQPPKPQPTSTQHVASREATFVPPDHLVIRAPVITPTELPAIDPLARFDPSKVKILGGDGPITRDARDTLSARASGDVLGAEGVERIAALISAPRPQYPETLRLAGVSGRVVVRFVVDTAGRVERESVHVLEASHARFENSVRDVLPRLRFSAAELAGSRVRMLVEMPFEFSIERR